MGALVLRLLSIALLSRLIAADSFGYYFLGQSVALVGSVAGNLSISYKVMEAGTLGRRQFVALLGLSVVLTTILFAALSFGLEVVAPGYQLWLFAGTGLVVAASAPVMSALRTAEALGRRLLLFRLLAWSEIWSTLVGFFVCAPALALLGYPAIALVGGHWCYVLLKLSLIIVCTSRGLPSVLGGGDKAPVASGRMSAYGLEVLDLASVHLMRLVIGAVFGQTVVALWSRGSQLVLLGVNLLVQPIAYVLVPLGLRDQARREHLAEQSPHIIDNLSLLLLPVAISVFIFSEEISVVLLGHSWVDTAAYLQAFSLLLLGRTVQRAFGILGRATQTSAVRLGVDGGALAVFAVALAGLIHGGPLVAAWAFSASCCIAAGVHFACGSAGTRIWPWRFIGAVTTYAVLSYAFAHVGGLSAPLVAKIASAAIIWLAFGVACAASAWLARPLIVGGALLEFAHRMDHQTIR